MPDLKAHSRAILHRIRGLFDIRYFFSPSTIIPVMIINDKYYTPASTADATIATAVDTATLMISRDDKNTYIHSATLNVSQATLGSVDNAIINVVQNGSTKALLRMNVQATAQTALQTSITFPKPILIDRNTGVTIDLDAAATTSDQYTAIVSFSEEDAQEAHF